MTWQYFYTQYQNMIDILASMHRIGVAHNDVAARNVLVDTRRSQVVFVDFAFAWHFQKGIQRKLPYLRHNPPGARSPSPEPRDEEERYWVSCLLRDEMGAWNIVVDAGLPEPAANRLAYGEGPWCDGLPEEWDLSRACEGE
jgi:serine/threonine protein kinase